MNQFSEKLMEIREESSISWTTTAMNRRTGCRYPRYKMPVNKVLYLPEL